MRANEITIIVGDMEQILYYYYYFHVLLFFVSFAIKWNSTV